MFYQTNEFFINLLVVRPEKKLTLLLARGHFAEYTTHKFIPSDLKDN